MTKNLHQETVAYLKQYAEKELLRFVAVGSVDDGKSTLIGRLLHDTGVVFEDQLNAVKAATKSGKGNVAKEEAIDFALLTDGLKAEREQGITIDVAYRYFSTDRRKFIIADTPGHVQYTRNMVTGASTAHVALILIDARLGVLEQSKRHAHIASMLGIPQLAVCINKMDLVGYDKEVYQRILGEFEKVVAPLGFSKVNFFPVSALKGSNVVTKSQHTAWYDGPTVLEYLETTPLDRPRTAPAARLAVQYVIRPNLDYRGYAGEVAGKTLSVGDTVVALPSQREATVTAIDTFSDTLQSAEVGEAVVVRIDKEIDISRGDMLVGKAGIPRVGRTFEADLVWMSESPIDLDKTYVLKHTTQQVRAQVQAIDYRIDMDTLEHVDAKTMRLNDIGRARISTLRALYYDAYDDDRATGSFILIDSLTNNTVAAGMIRSEKPPQSEGELEHELHAGSAIEPKTQVSPKERLNRLGQRGVTVWLTGLPGSGRWSLAYALERRLFDEGRTATVINPIDQSLQTMASAAKACTDAGMVTICAFASYHKEERAIVKRYVGKDRFVQIYVNTDPEICRERRPDASFEGFEPPKDAQVTVALDRMEFKSHLDTIVERLDELGFF